MSHPGVRVAPGRCGRPIVGTGLSAGRFNGLGHKKNAARGDSSGAFHFIELPKGKDSLPRQSDAACRLLSERVASKKPPPGEKAEGRRGRERQGGQSSRIGQISL